jgi:hypothetical protein
MPLPAPVIASIVSAVIETVVQSPQSPEAPAVRYGEYVAKRTLPPEAKLGFMLPPPGDGTIVIDDKKLPLSPIARFRNEKNLIVMPMSVRQPSNVVYLNDNFGNVFRVWMISQADADSLEND